MHVYPVPAEVRRGMKPLKLELQMVMSAMWVREQPVRSTEPLLQPTLLLSWLK